MNAFLSAFVKHGHDNSDTSCLTRDSRYYTLEILEMIVGAHGYFLAVHTICHAVVEAVTDNVYIVTSHRVVEHTLCLTRTESRAVSGVDERAVVIMAAPLTKIVIDLVDELITTFHSDNRKFSE